MASIKLNGAIWAALIAAAATIIAALITALIHDRDGGDGGGKASSTPTSTARVVTGSVVVPPPDNATYVYPRAERDDSDNVKPIASLSNRQRIEIVCTVEGRGIAAANGKASTLWYKIRYNSGYAFVSDAYVETDSNPVAPSCP
jgi:hypothetical protein